MNPVECAIALGGVLMGRIIDTEEEIATALDAAGLEIVEIFEEMIDTAPGGTAERAVYITRKR